MDTSMRASAIVNLVVAVSVFSVACSTSSQAQDDRSLLLTLEGREHTIVISTGPDGPRYTMKSSTGHTVFSDLNINQIRERDPEVYERIDAAIADKDASLGHESW